MIISIDTENNFSKTAQSNRKYLKYKTHKQLKGANNCLKRQVNSMYVRLSVPTQEGITREDHGEKRALRQTSQ